MLHAMVGGDPSRPLAKLALGDKSAPTQWTMTIQAPVTSAIVKDVIIVCQYTVKNS